ncbi:MAG: glycine--tRNA ligase subunit beta [Pseudomonadota bacterium]
MADFLLELRSEEIPARMQAGARSELEKLFRREMDAAGVSVGDVTVWSTPRRLALIAKDLPTQTEAVREEAKGPPVGAPDQAVDGFCRKSGVTRDQLEEREVKGRATWFAVIEKPGQAVTDLLGTAIPTIVRAFSWPKSMRWGEASLAPESLKWVRPLSGIIALLDGEVVPCEVDGIASSRTTMGHRFHHSGPIEVADADGYADALREAYVIVDHEVRAGIIREGASKAARAVGLSVVEDEGLVVENAGLTEWPAPLLGRFDEEFLDVPPEVIQLTARVNQKYFVCESRDPSGATKLANAFICTANIAADDPAVVVDGNRKVLAARLADARFFWELDQKKTLAEHAEGLERITFHEKLGTVADKVARVANLARWLVEEGIVGGSSPSSATNPVRPEPVEGLSFTSKEKSSASTSSARTASELANLAEQAARLCKADLVTEMVGEFPELQGLMGGYYAEKEGLPREVSDAIRDHYKPMGQGDEVPTAPVTVAVSLADKLDTLVSFFRIEEFPTGSKDPFALRRATISILSLLQANNLRINLKRPIEWVQKLVVLTQRLAPMGQGGSSGRGFGGGESELYNYILDFFADRLKVQQREAGVRHDLIDAVFALGGEDDLVRLLARVKALQAFVETDEGTNLLAGYKRAANILRKEGHSSDTVRPELVEGPHFSSDTAPDQKKDSASTSSARTDRVLSYSPEAAEKDLIDALDAAGPKASAALEAEDFEAAMSALASLRAPIDAFFEEVTVNDDDPAKRAARLDLLARFRDAVHRVADFSRIEG